MRCEDARVLLCVTSVSTVAAVRREMTTAFAMTCPRWRTLQPYWPLPHTRLACLTAFGSCSDDCLMSCEVNEEESFTTFAFTFNIFINHVLPPTPSRQ